MRVLHFYKTAFPDSMGGVEQAIHQIATGCCKHGVKTDVLSLSKHSGEKEFEGYISHRAQLDFHMASTPFSISVFWKFLQLAKHVDVVHYHFPWPLMDVVHFLARVQKPSVVTYHSDIVRQKNLLKLYRPLQHQFLKSVDRIVATSPHYIQTSEVLKKYTDKISIIPLGLDQSSYPIPSSNKVTSWRDRFGGKFFLFVGVLRYYKGLHILLEACQGTTFPLLIVGSGPMERDLKEQAIRLKLTHVHFLGSLPDDDKVTLLRLCIGIVFPSHLRSEAFGLSLLEGAMYGKPMISCDIGTGTTFINKANETGLVIPPENPTALKEAMSFLWDNPDEALAMGKRAKARYETYFTADRMVEDYVNLYRSLLNKKEATCA